MCTASTWIQSNIFASIVQFNRKAKQQFKITTCHHFASSRSALFINCNRTHSRRARPFVAHFVLFDDSELLLTFSFQSWISSRKNNNKKKSPCQIIIMRNRNENHIIQTVSSDIGHLTWWFGGFIVFSIDTFRFIVSMPLAATATVAAVALFQLKWIARMIHLKCLQMHL